MSFGRLTSSDTGTSLCACCRLLYGLGQRCVRIRALYFIHVYICGDYKDRSFDYSCPSSLNQIHWYLSGDPLLMGLRGCMGGLNVRLSGYSHYLPPQSPAQLSLNQGVNGNGAGTRNYYWRDIPTCTMRNLAWCLLLWCLGLGHA